jgi:hypothetical protein
MGRIRSVSWKRYTPLGEEKSTWVRAGPGFRLGHCRRWKSVELLAGRGVGATAELGARQKMSRVGQESDSAHFHWMNRWKRYE